ncbi:MAG: roadblock/LC7 domain-containing protein [Candidatus Helarchaeota archaeon]|nr:roadblock/LC7 domain-containing protein [Candidatus Helarchaeota archaeon]
MSEINGIWILEADGNLLFSHEIFGQGSEDFASALFSGLILSIQKFIQELGEKKAERIEMGNTKFFISKDTDHDLFFVIKTTQNASNNKTSKLLNKVQKRFKQKFGEFLKKFSLKQLRIYIDNIFRSELSDILKDFEAVAKERFSEFFNSI